MTGETKVDEPSEMDVDVTSGSNEHQLSCTGFPSKTAAAVEGRPTQENGADNNASMKHDQMIIDDTVNEPPAAGSPQLAQENATESRSNTESSNGALIISDDERKRTSSPSDVDVPSKKRRMELQTSDHDNAASEATKLNSTNNDILQKPPSAPNEDSNAADLPSDNVSREVMMGYEKMESSVAKLIQDKLEPIDEVVPLRPLSLRDLGLLHWTFGAFFHYISLTLHLYHV